MKLGHKILDKLKEDSYTVWHEAPTYWYTQDDENTIRFAAKKDDSHGHTIEIAELDLRPNTLYINSDYKERYKKPIRDIKRDYEVEKVSEYTKMI